jgi:hypothetical protein
MDNDIARVMRVRATGERSLRVRFAGERRDHELDMTGLIARSVHFAPLMDAKTFAKVCNRGRRPWSILARPDKVGSLGRFGDDAAPDRGRAAADDRGGFCQVADRTGPVVDGGSRSVWRQSAYDHGLFAERRPAPGRGHCLPGARSRQACPGSALCAGAQRHPPSRIVALRRRPSRHLPHGPSAGLPSRIASPTLPAKA